MDEYIVIILYKPIPLLPHCTWAVSWGGSHWYSKWVAANNCQI